MTDQNFTLPLELRGRRFKIRRMTPLESFRLMGVEDADIWRLMSAERNGRRVLSDSSLLKLAGNSIVVDVLYHVLRTLFIDTGQPTEPGTQLMLF